MPSIEISERAYEYLKARAIPFEDTAAEVFDRIVSEHAAAAATSASPPQISNFTACLELIFGLSDTPNVSFTTISAATIDGKPSTLHYWNDILEALLARALKKAPIDELDSMLNLQFSKQGNFSGSGYRPIADSGFSFQGVDANRACSSIAMLSKSFDIPVTLNVHWQNKAKAQFPGKSGTIKFP